MTTIAWDGRMVAADSMAVACGYKNPLPARKLELFAGQLFGFSGPSGYLRPCINWWNDGRKPSDMPHTANKDGYNFVVFQSDGHTFTFSDTNPYSYESGAPDAWGSGCEYAIGAMLFAASAWQAVEVACQANPSDTAPPVYGYELVKGKWVRL
jgi:hypothetical protein